jgi:rRNA maturation RNase YbeY
VPDVTSLTVTADYGDFDDVEAALPLPTLTDLVRFVYEAEGASLTAQLGFAFVNEAEIVDLHERYLGDTTRTDILTFPDAPDTVSGEIAICVPVAADNATELETSTAREAAFLVVHGLLHLLGWNDESDQARSVMLARQDVLLDQWGGISR